MPATHIAPAAAVEGVPGACSATQWPLATCQPPSTTATATARPPLAPVVDPQRPSPAAHLPRPRGTRKALWPGAQFTGLPPPSSVPAARPWSCGRCQAPGARRRTTAVGERAGNRRCPWPQPPTLPPCCFVSRVLPCDHVLQPSTLRQREPFACSHSTAWKATNPTRSTTVRVQMNEF